MIEATMFEAKTRLSDLVKGRSGYCLLHLTTGPDSSGRDCCPQARKEEGLRKSRSTYLPTSVALDGEPWRGESE